MFFTLLAFTIFAIPIRGYIMRCKEVNYLFLTNKAKCLYHYTNIEHLEKIFSKEKTILVGNYNFNNITNYMNILFKVKKSNIIFFFLDEPSTEQLWINNLRKEYYYPIIIDIEKSIDMISDKKIYYRQYDKAIIIVSDLLTLDENAICLGGKTTGNGNFSTYIKVFTKKL